MKKILIPLSILLACVATAATVFAQSGRRPAPPAPNQNPVTPVSQPEVTEKPPAPATPHMAAGEPLPASIIEQELFSLEQERFRLADFKGKVVVLNLWASWCGPCRAETPELERVSKDYAARGVQVIGLSIESPQSDAAKVRKFVRDQRLSYKIGWADRTTAITLMAGRNVVPQTFVIDGDGQIVRHMRGYSTQRSESMLREAVDSALAQAGANQ